MVKVVETMCVVCQHPAFRNSDFFYQQAEVLGMGNTFDLLD